MQDIDFAPGGRPCSGYYHQPAKCEVFSRHGLDMFPLGIKKSDKPNMEILGIPIGDQDFYSSFIALTFHQLQLGEHQEDNLVCSFPRPLDYHLP